MISGKKKGRISGFTLMETLVTVAVIIVLLAVSMVAAVRYRDYLRITELDNAAREIYMAAQNRAVLLRNRDRLEKLVVNTDNKLSAGSNLFLYYKKNSDAEMSELLPDGAIDPALRDGEFYVVYEPESGSVTDVFFAKKAPLSTSSFGDFYDKYRNTGKNVRMKLNPMVGYYGGDSAASGDSVTLRTPVIDISNSDTLTATVTWWLPQILRTEMNKMELEVILDYQGQKVKLSEAFKDNPDRLQEKMDEGTIYIIYTSTYLLDSLVQGQQFKDLKDDVTKSGLSIYDANVWNALGKDFTITAEVKYTGTERRITGAIGKAEDNSLFAKSTTEDTAYIGCMRHLQNLHPDFSGAAQDDSAKTKAMQIADITNVQVPDATGAMVDYNFVPIMNYMLTSYDGQKHEIRELYIDDKNRVLPEGAISFPYTGLFGIFSGASSEIKGVRLVNSKIWGDINLTGALCGLCSNANIRDCQVYWENSAGYSNLQHFLGSTDGGKNYALDEPMIQGGTVGGFVGSVEGCLTIEGCLVATTIKGESIAGGLAGYTDGDVIVSRSHADCYLEGKDVAGLIGAVRKTGNKIENSYAAGFISVADGGRAAGLYLKADIDDNPSIAINNSYSAMGYSSPFNDESAGGTGSGSSSASGSCENRYPLGDADNANTSYTNTYYLYSPYVNPGKGGDNWYGLSLDYEQLANEVEDENILAKLGGNFVMKNAVSTHAYNLQDELSLSRYPYPGIEGLDHYGDWSASFQVGSLVYWEQYANESYEATEIGIEGGGVKTLQSGRKVSDDGYAVALSQTQIADAGNTIEIDFEYEKDGTTERIGENYEQASMPTVNLQIDGETGSKTETYYLAKLPDELMTTETVSETFYQKLNVTLSSGVNKKTLYYYNPHFAATVIEADEELSDDALSALAKNAVVRVRSPRHLYELSKHKEYYGSANNYTFLQELDLDYTVYVGYGLFWEERNGTWNMREAVQPPIGSDRMNAFADIYDGGSHLIIHVPLDTSKGNYVGLFGYNSGTIRNVVYIGLTSDNSSQTFNRGVSESSTTVYVGALAGGNSGNISNSAVAAVRLELSAYHYSTVYAGGLVGVNYGTITNTEVTIDEMTADANYSNMYLGSFAGQNMNGATIASCYAIGRIEASKARYGNVYACGFAGRNSGTLRDSYAAADLSVSGGAEEYGFCRDDSSNCYFLDEGNFQYRGKVFSAQYTDGESASGASGQAWMQMTTNTGSEESVLTKLSSAGFELGAAAKYGNTDSSEATFAFPGIVRDVSNGNQLVHYGPWPELTKLGALGVFYWEKEVKQGKDAYHFSAISVDTDSNSVSEMSTLCTAHDDGGVIEEYGYGYFYTGSLVANGWKDDLANHRNTSFAVDAENREAEKQLSSMMGGAYNFVAYTTTTAPDPDGSKTKTWLEGDVTEDIWVFTLSNGNTYQFKVNPFFADSFSYMVEGGTTSPQVQNVELGAEEKPYVVRSVEQLRYINWKWESKKNFGNTNTEIIKGNCAQFVYLSSENRVVRRYWEQSHDIQGDESVAYYSPIAEFHDTDKESTGSEFVECYGWFGGDYDGKAYTIRKVDIKSQFSTVGLFGVTVNAGLRNIILYSPNGDTEVVGQNTEEDSNWYAIGALVGLAAEGTVEGDDSGKTIENCSVAGYKIIDLNKGCGYGGAGVGGILGICNMNLEGCTAVTDIIIDYQYEDGSRNIRIGGIAGSCMGEIRKCYAGGEIKVNIDNATRIHAGGITGGSYMKPLKITINDINEEIKIGKNDSSGSNNFEKCYSYVTLPSLNKNKLNNSTNTLYAIGGRGELGALNSDGYVNGNYKDCYCLEDIAFNALSNNGFSKDDILSISIIKDKEKVARINYETMSSEDFRKNLNKDIVEKSLHFSTVTKEDPENGSNISGKYSLSTKQSLTGMNYPFPTILTQTTASGKTVNVHYGDWPLAGIEREDGDVPIALDIFGDEDNREAGVEEPGGTSPGSGASPEEDESDNTGDGERTLRTKEIKLTLSEILKDAAPNGTLTVTCENVLEDENEGTGSLPQNPGGDEPKGHVVKAQFKAPDKTLVDELEVGGTSKYEGAYEGADAVLVISAQEQGSAVVKVSYTPDSGTSGESPQVVDLEIEVNVSANLQLLPAIFEKKSEGTGTPGEPPSTPELTVKKLDGEPVAFTKQETSIDLYAFNLNDDPISGELHGQVKELRVKNIMCDTQRFSEATVKDVASEDSGEAAADPLRKQMSVTGRELTGITAVTVDFEYDYTYTDKSGAEPVEITRTYQGTSTVNTRISEFELEAEPLVLYLDEEDTKQISWTLDMLRFLVDKEEKKIASTGDTEDKILNPVLTIIRSGDPERVFPEENPDGSITVSGKKAGRAVLIFQVQFSYKACSHTVQVFVETTVYDTRLEMISSQGSNGITLFAGAKDSGTVEDGGNTAESGTGGVSEGDTGSGTGDTEDTPQEATVTALFHADVPVTYSWTLSGGLDPYLTMETEVAEVVTESSMLQTYGAGQNAAFSVDEENYDADELEPEEVIFDEETVQTNLYGVENTEAQATLGKAVLKLKDDPLVSLPPEGASGTLTVTATVESAPEGGNEAAGTSTWTKTMDITLVAKPTAKFVWSKDQSVFTNAGIESIEINESSIGTDAIYLAVVPDSAVKEADPNTPNPASLTAQNNAYTVKMASFAGNVIVEPDAEISAEEIVSDAETQTEDVLIPMADAGEGTPETDEGAADAGNVELLPKDQWQQGLPFADYKILRADKLDDDWTIQWQAIYGAGDQATMVEYTEQVAQEQMLHVAEPVEEPETNQTETQGQSQEDNMSPADTPNIVFDMDLILSDESEPDTGEEEILLPEDETDGNGEEEIIPPEPDTDVVISDESEPDTGSGEELLPPEDETDGNGGEEILPPETEPYTEPVLLNEFEQDPSSEMETMSLAEQADDAAGEEFLLPETELGTEMFLSGDFGQDGEIDLSAETEIYLDDLSA